MQYVRAQHLGLMDFSSSAVVEDFQRLAGKIIPWLPALTDADRIRLRQELCIVEQIVDRMSARSAVARAEKELPARPHPLFPQRPLFPETYTPPSMHEPAKWRLRTRGPGSQRAGGVS